MNKCKKLDKSMVNGTRIGAISILIIFSVVLLGMTSATDVSSCQTIGVSGSYILTQDLNAGGGTCFDLTGNNIIINGNGHTIYNAGGDYGVFFGTGSNTLSNLTINYTPTGYSGIGIYFCENGNNTLSNIILNIENTTNYNSVGIQAELGNSNIFSNITINSANLRYGIKFVESNYNVLSNLFFTGYINQAIYLDSGNGNIFSVVNISKNVYGGIYIKTNNNNFTNIIEDEIGYSGISISGANNIFKNVSLSRISKPIINTGSNNLFYNLSLKNNLNTNLINSSLIGQELAEKIYQNNQNVNFTIPIYNINGSQSSDFNYNISIYPQTSYVMSTSGNNLTISFTPTKEGLYSMLLNVTTLSDNNIESSKPIFLIGNTSSANIRYYMYQSNPTHGQTQAIAGYDSGSGFLTIPSESQIRYCTLWMQYSPDQITNYYYIIKNISIGWFYKVNDVDARSAIDRYSAYDGLTDYYVSIPNSASYVFNVTNFTNLNITSDYVWRLYYLGFKLVGFQPYALSNATFQSYADLTYIYSGPQILQLTENNGSDIRDMQLLSNVFNDATKKNATLQFDGTGNFTLALNMANSSYNINYDGIACGTNANCTINRNSSGIINVTISLGSLHILDVFSDTTAPQVTITAPSGTYTTATAPISITINETGNCIYSLNGGTTNRTLSTSNNLTFTGTTPSLSNNDYTLNAYCNDAAGNLNATATSDFTIDVSSTSSDSGGSTTLGTISLTDSQFKSGYTQSLNTLQRIKFSVNNEVHYVGVISIGSDSAVINVSSDEQLATLSVGESKEFEVTGDNYYDINVTLNSVSGSTATIKVMAVHDLMPGNNQQNQNDNPQQNDLNTDGNANENSTSGNSYLNVLVIVLVIILAVIVLLLRRRLKNK